MVSSRLRAKCLRPPAVFVWRAVYLFSDSKFKSLFLHFPSFLLFSFLLLLLVLALLPPLTVWSNVHKLSVTRYPCMCHNGICGSWSTVLCFLTLMVGGSEPVWTLLRKKKLLLLSEIEWLCSMLHTKTFWYVFHDCFLLLKIFWTSLYKNHVLCSITNYSIISKCELFHFLLMSKLPPCHDHASTVM
jgi:Threonyl-tRNA synthetase